MIKLFPDYSSNVVSIDDIHRSLLLNGCCILRGVLEKKSVVKLANQIEAISQKKAEQVRTGELTDTYKRFHIFEPEFQDFYTGSSLYDVILNTKLYEILEALFGAGKFHQHPLTNCRGVDVRAEKDRDLTSFRPLVFHIDAAYHPPYDKFAINFWIPLNECGINSPGIQVVPMNHTTVRRLLSFDPKVGFTEPTDDESPWSMKNVWRKIAEGSPDAVVWRPSFSLGDVMVMTSWVPHASYSTDDMMYPRRSIEMRHYGEELDPRLIIGASFEETYHSLTKDRSDCVQLSSIYEKA